MKKKVLLEYDEDTAQIFDKDGTIVAVWDGLQSFPYEEQQNSLSDNSNLTTLKDLKLVGYTVEEIVALKQNALI